MLRSQPNMFKKYILIGICTLLIASAISHADSLGYPPQDDENSDNRKVQLVTISADNKPNETYSMGFNFNSQQQITGVYYQNNFDIVIADRNKIFSLTELISSPQVLIKKREFTVVKISYLPESLENSNRTAIKISFPLDVRDQKNDVFTRIFPVACSDQAHCQIWDGVDGSLINHIHLKCNYLSIFNIAIGIKSLETSLK